MKTCRNCGQQFNDDMNFCAKCGIQLTAESQEYFCPKCGKALGKKYDSFCPYCGLSFVSTVTDTKINYRPEAQEEKFQKEWAQKKAKQESERKLNSIGFVITIILTAYLLFKHL